MREIKERGKSMYSILARVALCVGVLRDGRLFLNVLVDINTRICTYSAATEGRLNFKREEVVYRRAAVLRTENNLPPVGSKSTLKANIACFHVEREKESKRRRERAGAFDNPLDR